MIDLSIPPNVTDYYFDALLYTVADPENFGGGDLKPKPQKFGCLHQN